MLSRRRRAAIAVVVVVAGAAVLAPMAQARPAATAATPWATKADGVCVAWLARLKAAFANPVTAKELYAFAVKARALESGELAALEKLPGRPAAGRAALAALRVDIAEIAASIAAADRGDGAQFVSILKRYLDDGRARAAFARAGARRCG